jgi:hypothetical protein
MLPTIPPIPTTDSKIPCSHSLHPSATGSGKRCEQIEELEPESTSMLEEEEEEEEEFSMEPSIISK